MNRKITYSLIICSSLFTILGGYLFSGSGYLNRYAESHMLLKITPPTIASPAQVRDEQTFESTRKYEGNARWQQAIHDANADQQTVLAGFNCATSLSLDEKSLPHLTALLTKTMADTSRLARKSKQIYHITRPYKRYQGTICSPASGYEYPSGHAMEGWTMALVLSEIFPDKQSQIFEHARSFAESRVICGAHSVSAVEVDEFYAKKIIKRLKKLTSFQHDLSLAKAELAHLPQQKNEGGSCEKFPAQFVKPFSPYSISKSS